MYKHILIPTDGSEYSKRAIAHGVALAAALNAKVSALAVALPLHSIQADPTAVVDTSESGNTYVRDYLHGQSKKYLEVAEIAASEKGICCESIYVEHEHPYAAIIKTAQAKNCDLIVMASHGRRGVSAIILGSETVKVLTHSQIPVLVHRC